MHDNLLCIMWCISGEGNEDTIGAKGNTQAMERQNSDGSMVELRVGADGGGLGGAAKSGGRDRTPTKGHYMKVM